MKYRVLRNNYGFQGQYWHRDDIVDLDPKSNPPEHFLALEVIEEPKPVVPKSAVELEVPARPTAPKPTDKKAKPKKRLK